MIWTRTYPTPSWSAQGQAPATAVRFKLLDMVHGIDSTGIQAVCADWDMNFPLSVMVGEGRPSTSFCFSQPLKEAENISKTEETKPEIKEEAEEPENTKLIRFIYSVPKFLGHHLEVYGPFEEDDTANLPEEIADILIKKGRAEEIKK